jgi:hypothetical protein
MKQYKPVLSMVIINPIQSNPIQSNPIQSRQLNELHPEYVQCVW